ncbi:MAG: hypothetical protein ACTJHU_04550 [Mycetocola sp.]
MSASAQPVPAEPALTLSGTPSAAGARTITDAELEWGINGQLQHASQAGGCDYLSAGTSDGTLADYATEDGNVRIIKRKADGSHAATGWSTRCTYDGVDSTNGQRLLMSGGTGDVAADGSAQIAWTGTATINSYGGLLPWSISNPVLHLDANGDGTLRATLGGFNSNHDRPFIKVPIDSVEDVEIATVRGGVLDASHDSVLDLAFAGVDYFPLVDGVRSSTSAIDESIKQTQGWGSWPTGFVDFHYLTGLSSYWHSSGGSADANKAPDPLTVRLDGAEHDTAPAIVREPQSVTLSAGAEPVLLSSTAGSPRPTLQWQEKQGETWNDLPGATGDELRPGVLSEADSGRTFRAVATSSSGRVESAAAVLTVVPKQPVQITRQPSSVSSELGSSVVFSVQASGSTLSYLWERSTDAGRSWSAYGGTGASTGFEIFRTASASGYLYRVTVSNGVDPAVVSDVATLTLNAAEPVVERQPQSVEVPEGTTAQFSAAATGIPLPTWSWQISRDGGDHWEQFSSQSARASSNLSSPVFSRADDGALVRIELSNSSGTTHSENALVRVVAVEDSPVVRFNLRQPLSDDGSVVRGVVSGAGFAGLVSASGPFVGGLVDVTTTPLSDATPESIVTGSISVDPSSLGGGVFMNTFASVDPTLINLDHRYRFVLFGAEETPSVIADAAVILTGQSAPAFVDEPRSVTVAAGEDSVRLTAAATGRPEPDVSWQIRSAGTEWAEVEASWSQPAARQADGAEQEEGTARAELRVPLDGVTGDTEVRAVADNGIGAPVVSAIAVITIDAEQGAETGTDGDSGSGADPGTGSDAGSGADADSSADADSGVDADSSADAGSGSDSDSANADGNNAVDGAAAVNGGTPATDDQGTATPGGAADDPSSPRGNTLAATGWSGIGAAGAALSLLALGLAGLGSRRRSD